MSRNTGLAVGFVATVAVLVPAGWHLTDATIESDGKRVRPPQQSFTIDGVKVTLDVDRNLITTGGKVKARLVAFSDSPKRVAVDMTVLHSSNYEGERVEPVANVIDIEKLTLDAAPGGGKPVETILRLGEHVSRPGMTDTFRIYVAKKGVHPDKNEMFYEPTDDEGKPKPLTDAAAVTVMGWSRNNLHVTIAPEGKVRDDAPFFVNVRVKNTTKRKLQSLWVDLGTQVGNSGGIVESDDFSIERADDGDDISYERLLKPGATEVTRFKVTPKHKGLRALTFVATATSGIQPGPVEAGALDVKSFDVAAASAIAVK